MASTPSRPHTPRPRTIDIALLLVRWRARELRLARRFRECGGASPAEIEDLYDAVATSLIEEDRVFESEEHLRSALRVGIRLRALRLHRDRATRIRIVERSAPGMLYEQHERSWRGDPERALLAHEDDLIIGEFLAELSREERPVFALVAEGHSWRAIATRLHLPEPKARALTRSCERKRERFIGLYAAGRLCGYRSSTIAAVLAGVQSTDLAIRQALAHLRHCRVCQAEHRTSEAQLHSMFDERVLILLPVPLLAHLRLWLTEQLAMPASRVLRLAHRAPMPPSGARERIIEAAGAAGGGAAVKLAAGAIGVAVLAGSAVGITDRAQHHHMLHRRQALHARPTATVDMPVQAETALLHRQARVARHTRRPRQYEPGGFAYLGVPTAPRRASVASHHTPDVTQQGGGPFSP